MHLSKRVLYNIGTGVARRGVSSRVLGVSGRGKVTGASRIPKRASWQIIQFKVLNNALLEPLFVTLPVEADRLHSTMIRNKIHVSVTLAFK